MDQKELWQAVLAQIQLQISPPNFATWFKSTQIVSQENGFIFVSVPNSFTKEWLEQKYNKAIFKILYNLNRGIKGVKYEVEKSGLQPLKKFPIYSPVPSKQLDFQDLKVEGDTGLNSRYTFDNFLVGDFNELAHAAGCAVTQDPGKVYNPLFIYGGVGLGKTHLLQAIGNEVIKASNKKVRYVPTEKFVSRVISAIRNHKIEEFKAAYQKIDVLIIDDIQFLTGKEKTQEEFFYIFNSLYEKNKQIILSSDRPPNAIPALTERLQSRFGGGMITDISLPSLEARIAILKNKCDEKKASLPDDVLEYVSSNIKKNIRELEGALNTLIAYQKINDSEIDIKTTKNLLRNIISSSNKIINAKKIIHSVADFYDLKEKDLISSSRKREIVLPRQIAMYLLRQELKASYPFIGRKLGGKDHTTAIYACEKISKEIEKNENLTEEIELIKQRVLCG